MRGEAIAVPEKTPAKCGPPAAVMAVTVNCEIQIPIPGPGGLGDNDRRGCPGWKGCYSKNLHTDEPEVQMKTQGEGSLCASR